MKRSLLIILFLVFGLFPISALAGSCSCTRTYSGPTSESTCITSNANGTVNSQADCESTNNTVVTINGRTATYSNCNYCSDYSCQAGCSGGATTAGMTQIDKSCTVDRDCLQNKGTSVCYNSRCWLNSEAMTAYQDSRVTFFGVSRDVKIQKPLLEIRIPGVEFNDAKDSVDAQGFLHIDYLPKYLAAIYSFAMAAASMVAVVIIILNGFRIAVSAGGEEKNKGIQNVTKAITGLFILWSSYALFYTINPALTQFKALSVKYVEPVMLEAEEEVSENPQDVSTMLTAPIGTNIQAAQGVKVADSVLQNLRVAATSLINQNIMLYVTSGWRDPEKQKALIKQNCSDPTIATTCSPPTCMMKNGDPKNCPHTTGKAVDVWGYQNGKQCVLQKQCSSNPDADACRKDPCQKAVIDAMKYAGFCNLRSEAWHFELPKMSGSCN